MIKIIGKNNCNKCVMTKNICDEKNIPYHYISFEDLSIINQNYYLAFALKFNVTTLPLIIYKDKIIDLKEIDKCI